MATIASSEVKQKDVVTLKTYRSRSLWQDAWRRLIRNRAAVVGMVVVALFVFVALFASVLAPHDPLQLHDGKGYLPPAWVEKGVNGKAGEREFILGTDTIGRDVLSRLIYGARVSLFVGLLPVIVILIIGTAIGLLSGYTGGTLDDVLMRITDVFYAFPDLLFFILLVVTLRDTSLGQAYNGLLLLFLALALVSWVGVARLVRGSVLSMKQREFVEAAHAMGASDNRVMRSHVLPNILSPLIVWVAFSIPRLIITEATLGYLGLGLRPATDSSSFFITSWGVLMLEGRGAMTVQPWILLAPSLCVGLVVLAFTFVGDGLRDALDPQTR
jgi:ABC-type dipeptide/oligopeptide/nickel transport system permease subunit